MAASSAVGGEPAVEPAAEPVAEPAKAGGYGINPDLVKEAMEALETLGEREVLMFFSDVGARRGDLFESFDLC